MTNTNSPTHRLAPGPFDKNFMAGTRIIATKGRLGNGKSLNRRADAGPRGCTVRLSGPAKRIVRYDQPIAALDLTILCSRFRPEGYGGVEERLWRTTQALARRGVGVQVLTENRVNAPESETMAPGLTVRRLPPFDAGRFWRWYYAAEAYYWNRAVSALATGEITAVADPAMALGALLARPRRLIAFNPAACAAGMLHIWTQRPDVDSMKVPRHLVWIDRLAYKYSDVVIVSSENVKRQFARFYGGGAPVHVLPYVADPPEKPSGRALARARFGIDAQAFCVGFAGRLDRCKDVPFLLRAFREMGPSSADRLLVVGTGPDEERLRRIAAELALDRHIVWAGRMESPPNEAYAAMDVLVLPSVYEAFGLVLVEAMAAGIPVIGRADDGQTVFTASAELVKPECGFVVEANDPGELTGILDTLRNHPERAAQLGRNARVVALQSSWDDYARAYLELLGGASQEWHAAARVTKA